MKKEKISIWIRLTIFWVADYDYNRAKEIFNELIRFAEEGFTYDTLDNGVRTTKSKFYRLPRDNK